MIQLFRTNQPYIYPLLLIYTIVLRAGFLFFSVHAVPPANYSFAGQYFAGWLLKEHTSIGLQMVDIALIFAQGIFFNFILTSNSLFEKRTHIPALLFITFSSCFGEWIVFSVETVARMFVLLSLYNLFSLSRNELSRENIFYTSLYLSLGALFYFPVIVFLPVVLVGLFIRSYSIRDFVLILAGYLFPFYALGIIFYYHDKLKDYLQYLAKIFTPKALLFDLSIAQLGFLAFLLLTSFYAFIQLRINSDYKVIKSRRMYNLIFMFLGLVIAGAPFVLSDQINYLRLLIIPMSVFASRIFDREKLSFYHYLLFASVLIGITFFQTGYFGWIDMDKIRF